MEDKLIFPVDDYTLKTQEVNAPGISHTVTYKEYDNITYCANPVDADYESMKVFVPVSVDGVDVDTSDAPILIDNHVQAYTSWNIRTDTPGRAHRGEPMPGGPGGPGGHGPGGPGGPGGPDNGERHGIYGKPFFQWYALTQGLVVVKPGSRGRDNVTEDGIFYGKAPAVLVDLKACVRYIRHNKDVFPGSTDKIFSNGGSAGGAVSAGLGASADYADFEPYLEAIGAADESDAILGAICHCPIMDLGHADAAYEWMYGKYPGRDGLVDQEKSAYLAGLYADYIDELGLKGHGDFGTLTSDNLGEYIATEYMFDSADKYLNEDLTPEERDKYLAENPWISWDGSHATFTFADLTGHIGRMKQLGSFDGHGERSVFGSSTQDEVPFTDFGAKETDPDATVDPEIAHIVDLMNPMFYVENDYPGCSKHWYIVVGSKDPHTAHSVSAVFNTLLENKGMDTTLTYLWDYGHQCEDDPVEMVEWIKKVAEGN